MTEERGGVSTNASRDTARIARSLIGSLAAQGLRFPSGVKDVLERATHLDDRPFDFTVVDGHGPIRVVGHVRPGRGVDRLRQLAEDPQYASVTAIVASPSRHADLLYLRFPEAAAVATVPVRRAATVENDPNALELRLRRSERWNDDELHWEALRPIHHSEIGGEAVLLFLPTGPDLCGEVRFRYHPWRRSLRRTVVDRSQTGLIRIVRDFWSPWDGRAPAPMEVLSVRDRKRWRYVSVYLNRTAGVRPDSLQLLSLVHRESSRHPGSAIVAASVEGEDGVHRMVWDRRRKVTRLEVLAGDPFEDSVEAKIQGRWSGGPA